MWEGRREGRRIGRQFCGCPGNMLRIYVEARGQVRYTLHSGIYREGREEVVQE